MKHVGLCAKDGPEEKTGELHLQQSRWSSRVTAVLSIAGEECIYGGSLADAYTGMMACPGRAPVPLGFMGEVTLRSFRLVSFSDVSP